LHQLQSLQPLSRTELAMSMMVAHSISDSAQCCLTSVISENRCFQHAKPPEHKNIHIIVLAEPLSRSSSISSIQQHNQLHTMPLNSRNKNSRLIKNEKKTSIYSMFVNSAILSSFNDLTKCFLTGLRRERVVHKGCVGSLDD
jgi:hypothetical protein